MRGEPVGEHVQRVGNLYSRIAEDTSTDGSDTPYVTLVRSLLPEDERWSLQRRGAWIVVTPPGGIAREQGWKLHVSATRRSAVDVISAVVPVITKHGCAFKTAASKRVVELLNEGHYPRGSSGKIVTIYPTGDEQLEELARACHEATRGMEGPRILSDRPYRHGSLVHYRYGAFKRMTVMQASGSLSLVVHDPEGNPVPDERKAWYSPPPWAPNPFGDDDAFVTRSQASVKHGGPILHQKYKVETAIRHANKGGVYKAVNLETKTAVVIKEARRHVATDRHGRDATDYRRLEARNLRHVQGTGIAPKLLDEFSIGQHCFIVVEYLEGTILTDYVLLHRDRPWWQDHLMNMVRQLTELVDRAHRHQMLLRDLNPNNLMVLDSGQLKMVDLEHATLLSDEVSLAITTPGFASAAQRAGKPPSKYDDYFSLGATTFYLAFGRPPTFVDDAGGGPGTRLPGAKVSELTLKIGRAKRKPAWLVDIILRSVADVPEERWSPRQILQCLDSVGGEDGGSEASSLHGPPQGQVTRQELATACTSIVSYLLDTANLNGDAPWSRTCFGSETDPANIQHGVAGVLLGLMRCGATERDRLREIGEWLVARAAHADSRHDGLYFGRAGTAWALLELGYYLSNEEFLACAHSLAEALPDAVPSPDITHGTAGLGLMYAFFWERSGQESYRERTLAAARALARRALRRHDGVFWPQGSSEDEDQLYYGFAHGTAGIAYFLMLAAHLAGASEIRDLALEACKSLVDAAHLDNGKALWPMTPSRKAKWIHWCNGSSGVGSTLLRAYVLTGEETFLTTAEMAARAVMDRLWDSPLVHCHGLAGNGEFILDLYLLLEKPEYWRMVRDIADAIYTYRIVRDGYIVFPNETGLAVSVDHASGLTGILMFLYRMLHLDDRHLMLDKVLLRESVTNV